MITEFMHGSVTEHDAVYINRTSNPKRSCCSIPSSRKICLCFEDFCDFPAMKKDIISKNVYIYIFK